MPPLQSSSSVRQLRAIREAAHALLTIESGEPLVRRVVQVLKKTIDADAYALWRFRPASGTWSILDSDGLNEEFAAESVPSPSHPDFLTNGALPILDVMSDPVVESRRALYERHGICTLLVIPLQLHAEHAATLTCYYRSRHDFSDEDLEVANALGDLTSTAITTSELLHDREERSRALETINETGRTIAGERDLQQLVQAVTDAATTLSGAQFGAFFYNVINQAGESYTLYTISGVPRSHFEKFPMPRNTDVFNPTFKGEGTVRSANIRKDARYGHNAPYHGLPAGHLPVVSYLAVPVMSRSGDVLGGLFFGHEQEGVFTDEAETAVEALAAQAAIAIENVRLYERLIADRAAVRKSEERYRSLVIASPEPQAVGTTDGRGYVVEDSPSWRAITGQTFEQMSGRGWLDCLHEDDRQPTESLLDSCIAARTIFQTEFRLRTRDGAYRWFAAKLVPVFEDDESVREWVGTCSDIDQRRRNEDHLRFLARANALLASSLDVEVTLANLTRLAVPALADWCAVDVWSDGTPGEGIRRLAVAHADPAKVSMAEELQKRFPTDPNREPLASLIRTGNSQLVSEVSDELLRSLARDEDHYRMARELGITSWMLVPLRARGRTVGNITFVNADSRRRFTSADLAHAEEFARRAGTAIDNAHLYTEAQEANRAKDDFLATLSHELRTPMTVILGWSRLLGEGNVDEETYRTAVDSIQRSAETQAELIDDVLDMSRIISGKLQIDPDAVDVAAVAESALNTLRPAAEARGVRVEFDRRSGKSLVTADSNRLRQIIWNLLSNAIKFSSRGGDVVLSVEQTGSTARITVRDSGRGISPEFLPHVFEPFRQAEDVTTRQHGGLGLGLAIVKNLVELHGGTIRAESEGEGKGATFIVDLPVRALADTAAPRDVVRTAGQLKPALPPYPELRGTRVLFLDDQPDARSLVRTVLQRCDAVVTAVGSVAEAIEQIDRQRFDVVVSDIAMPGEDGFGFISRLRARSDDRRDIPAIAMTAFGRQEDQDRILDAGFSAYIRKPVEPGELANAVRDAVRRA